MAKIGTTDQQRSAAVSPSNVLEDKHEIVKGDNLFRFIQGPQKIKTIFFPTVIEQEEKGVKVFKPSFRALNFLEKSPLIESIQEAEMTVRQGLGDESDISFSEKLNWFYLAINKNKGETIKVKPIKVPTTIKKFLTEIESKLDLQDPEYLLNGPFYLYDVLITKTVEPGKPARYGTKYTGAIYGNNKFSGMIPQEFLRKSADELIQEIGGWDKIFSEDEINAIEDCNINLEDVLKPNTELEIKEILQKYPINLLGRNSDGALIYPQDPEFGELLRSIGLNPISFDLNNDTPSPHISSPIKSGGIKSLKKEIPAPVEEVPVKTEEVSQTVAQTEAPKIVAQTEAAPKSLKSRLKNPSSSSSSSKIKGSW